LLLVRRLQATIGKHCLNTKHIPSIPRPLTPHFNCNPQQTKNPHRSLIKPSFTVASKWESSLSPDLEGAGGDGNGGRSVDVEMAQFIREEIRTAVRHEMNTTSTAPPSYDSSAPLLIEDNPTQNPNDDINAEAQDVNKQKTPG
jgi:hypothetical protein